MRKRRYVFPRFRDLDARALDVDLHMHTQRTDGCHSIVDILAAARLRRLRAVAFTEHVRRDSSWFPEFAREVWTAAEAYPELDVYLGCEAKALDYSGKLDASPEILSQCEIVLGSVHSIPDGVGGFISFSQLTPHELAQRECAAAVGLLKHAPIDVLAHPGGMYQRRQGAFPGELLRAIVLASLERGIAIEISGAYQLDAKALLQLCQELNPCVSLGSDVHKLEELGRCRRMMAALWLGAKADVQA